MMFCNSENQIRMVEIFVLKKIEIKNSVGCLRADRAIKKVLECFKTFNN
jgi:hypothetical protein